MEDRVLNESLVLSCIYKDLTLVNEVTEDYFDNNNIPYVSAEVTLLADSYITLPADKINSFNKLIDALEDNDDVQNVYHTWEMPDDEE